MLANRDAMNSRNINANNKSIGARVRERREQLGYQQIQLAQCLGLDVPAISKKERGEAVITAEQLAKLARLLGRSPRFFLQDVV